MILAIKIPSNEIKWETIKNETGDMFIVTSNKERTLYYIYSVVDDKLEKLGKAKSPPDLMQYTKPTKKRGKK